MAAKSSRTSDLEHEEPLGLSWNANDVRSKTCKNQNLCTSSTYASNFPKQTKKNSKLLSVVRSDIELPRPNVPVHSLSLLVTLVTLSQPYSPVRHFCLPISSRRKSWTCLSASCKPFRSRWTRVRATSQRDVYLLFQQASYEKLTNLYPRKHVSRLSTTKYNISLRKILPQFNTC